MTKASNSEPQKLAEFLARNRSINDVVAKFDLKPKAAQKAIRDLQKFGYDVFAGPLDFHEEATYVAVPKSELNVKQIHQTKRIWSWEMSKSKQPYGMVKFPATFSQPEIHIIPIDGILFGDVAHDEERFDRVLEYISTHDNTFGFLNGDIICEIKGGSVADREKRRLEITAKFIEKMGPVAHKFMWAQQGCLERRSMHSQGFDPLAYCCERLNIPYFTEPCYIDLVWAGRGLFTFWTMHGYSTAQTKGAKMNSLRRPAADRDATHFVITGHVGDAIWNPSPKIQRDTERGRLVECEEMHCILGNFKKYLGSDAARKGHSPSSLDTLILIITAEGKHHVKTTHFGASDA